MKNYGTKNHQVRKKLSIENSWLKLPIIADTISKDPFIAKSILNTCIIYAILLFKPYPFREHDC